jgi:3'(2'), 5'-bisphosphate nucleotidase
MDDRARQQAMDWALNAARKAGQLLVELAAKPLEVETKKDGSSVTNADYASHKIIGSELAASGWPVISEEGVRRPLSERQSWERFWLVDPLDGTSSFIRMRAGYAVNIALIEHDGKDWVPILGVVALPDLNEIYYGGNGLGVFKDKLSGSNKPPRNIRADEDASPPFQLLISWNESGTVNDLVADAVDPTQVRMRPISGARKFCLVAEGKAEIHARSTGYFEWDCAAGDALFRAQGMAVCDLITGRPLSYNGPTLRVGGLIACRLPQGNPDTPSA